MNDSDLIQLIGRQQRVLLPDLTIVFPGQLDQVLDVLDGLIAIGDVVEAAAFTEFGRPTTAYTLSEGFKASRDYRENFPDKFVRPAIPPMREGKAQRALVLMNSAPGPFTTAQLVAAMQVQPTARNGLTPWLKKQLDSGLIVKRDDDWYLNDSGDFKVGIFSDGAVVALRNGVKVTALSAAEQQHKAQFLINPCAILAP